MRTLADILIPQSLNNPDPEKPASSPQGFIKDEEGRIWKKPSESDLTAERRLFGKTITEMSSKEKAEYGIREEQGRNILPGKLFDILYKYVEPQQIEPGKNAIFPEDIQVTAEPNIKELGDVVGANKAIKDETRVNPNIYEDKVLKAEFPKSTYIDEVINNIQKRENVFGNLDSEGKPIEGDYENKVKSLYGAIYQQQIDEALKDKSSLPPWIRMLPDEDILKYRGINKTLPIASLAGNSIMNIGTGAINVVGKTADEIFGNGDWKGYDYSNYKTEQGMPEVIDKTIGTLVSMLPVQLGIKTGNVIVKGMTNPGVRQVLGHAIGFALPSLPQNVDDLISGRQTLQEFTGNIASEMAIGGTFGALDVPKVGVLTKPGVNLLSKTILPTVAPTVTRMAITGEMPEGKQVLDNLLFNFGFALMGLKGDKGKANEFKQRLEELPPEELTVENVTDLLGKVNSKENNKKEILDNERLQNDDILWKESVEKNRVSKEIYQPILNEILKELGNKHNGDTTGNAKSVESIFDKVLRKRETNTEYKVNDIKDGARGAVLVEDVRQFPDVLKDLKDKGFEIEVNLKEPLNEFGYKGVNSNKDLGEGNKGEIQVHTPESWDLKMVSDEIYGKWRGKKEVDFTKEEAKQYYKDIAKSKKIWDDYWGNLPSDLRDKISSFDKHGDVMIVPADKPSPRGDLPQDKPPSNERNNLPSADKYTNEPSSILNTNGNSVSDNLSIDKNKPINNKSQGKIISDEAYNKSKEDFKRNANENLNMNPVEAWGKMAKDVAVIGAYHFENGARVFIKWAGEMRKEFGNYFNENKDKFIEIYNNIRAKFSEGADKVAEFLFDIKPGENAGTLGIFGGLTGKGRGKNTEKEDINSTQKPEELNKKLVEIETEINRKSENNDKYKEYIDKAKEEIKGFEERIGKGEKLTKLEQSTLAGMKRKVGNTERYINENERNINKEKSERNIIENTKARIQEEPKSNILGAFWEQDIKPKKGETRRAINDITKGIVNLLAPTAGVNKKALDITSKMKGEREYEAAKLSGALEEIYKGFEKMKIQDQIDFIDRMKTGAVQKTKGLEAISKMLRQIDDSLFNELRKYKADLPYLQNHFRIFWERGSEEEAERLMKKNLQGSKGWAKQMKFETMTEGIYAGLIPRSTNPVELFTMHYNDAMKFITARKMFEQLKKSGLAEYYRNKDDVPAGWEKINDRIAKVYFPGTNKTLGEYYFDSGAARLINNYLSRDYLRFVYDDTGAFTKISGVTGKALLGIKNVYTAIELSLSPFHAVFETIETMGSTIGLGLRKMFNGMLSGDIKTFKSGVKDITTFPAAPVLMARTGGNVIRYIKNKTEFLETTRGKDFIKQYPEAEVMIQDLFEGGGKIKMDNTYKIDAINVIRRNIRTGNYIGALMRAIPGGAEAMMKPLFEVYIPRLKCGMYLKEYSAEIASHQRELEKGEVTKGQLARKVWNFTEDRFGEMNFDNLWWDRTFKTALQILFRSVTWKLGNLRAFMGAPVEQAKEIQAAIKNKRAPHLEPKLGWLFGMSVLTAGLGGTINYTSTGKLPNNLIGYIFPRIDANDPEQRISVPSYWKDIIHLYHNPGGYLTSSLSGIWSKVTQAMNNRDYYGTEIYSDDDNTFKQLRDIAISILPKPFSISSFADAQKKGLGTIKSMAGFSGFSKSPSYIGRTEVQNLIYEAYGEMNKDKTITKDEKDKRDYRNEIKDKIKNGNKEEAMNMIQEGIDKGYITGRTAENLISGQNTEKPVILFRFLDEAAQQKIIKKMDYEDLKKYGPFIKQNIMKKLPELNPSGEQYLNENQNVKLQTEYKSLMAEQKKLKDKIQLEKDENKREELKDKLYDIKDKIAELKDTDWWYEQKGQKKEIAKQRKSKLNN